MRTLCIGLLIALAAPALNAQEFIARSSPPQKSTRKWVRRITLAAACAGSLAFDSVSTRRAAAAGAVEANGLLAGSQGSPAWARVIGMKAGFCAAAAVMEETRTFGMWKSPAADWNWTAVNAGTASVYTWAGFHNLKLANELGPPKQ